MDTALLLRETRLRHGLNQRALARRCRTSQSYISRIERGQVSPTVESLDRLLQAMGERLVLHGEPGSQGNASTEDLRADFENLTPEERIAQAAELSYALTSLAGAARKESS